MNSRICNRIWCVFCCLALALFSRYAAAQDDQPDPAAADEAAPAKTSKQLIKEAYEAAGGADTFDKYDQVVKLCDAALAAEPNEAGRAYLMQLSAWAYNRRGKEYSKQAGEEIEVTKIEDLEAKAMADFQESIRRDPDKWQALHNRGVSYALQGKFAEALADFNRTIELNPRYPNAWFNRGEIQYEKGDYNKAVADYTQAIRLKPDDAGAYSARAHAYYQLRRYQGAVSDYTRAVQLAPQDAAARADRGDIYANLGYWSQAAADYRQAVELDDSYGRAYMGAAWVMATCPDQRFRDAKLAVESAQKAVALDGEDDWRYLDTLAAAYANAGDYEKAQTAVAKAIDKAPDSRDAALKARQALYAAGKPFRDTARTARNVDGANR